MHGVLGQGSLRPTLISGRVSVRLPDSLLSAVFGGTSVTGHVRTQNHSQEKTDRMPSLPYTAGRPAPLGS